MLSYQARKNIILFILVYILGEKMKCNINLQHGMNSLDFEIEFLRHASP